MPPRKKKGAGCEPSSNKATRSLLAVAHRRQTQQEMRQSREALDLFLAAMVRQMLDSQKDS